MASHEIRYARTTRAFRLLALAALAGCQTTPGERMHSSTNRASAFLLSPGWTSPRFGPVSPITPNDQPGQVSRQVVAGGRFVSKGGENTSGAYRIERVGGDLRLEAC